MEEKPLVIIPFFELIAVTNRFNKFFISEGQKRTLTNDLFALGLLYDRDFGAFSIPRTN